MPQKQQNGEGEVQESPVPKDIACESEVSSEAYCEQDQRDDCSHVPGGKNGPARPLQFRSALRWDGTVHGGASCHGPDRREVPGARGGRPELEGDARRALLLSLALDPLLNLGRRNPKLASRRVRRSFGLNLPSLDRSIDGARTDSEKYGNRVWREQRSVVFDRIAVGAKGRDHAELIIEPMRRPSGIPILDQRLKRLA